MGWSRATTLLVLILAALVGCDDPNEFRIDPRLAADTVVIAVPVAGNDALPSAVDITVGGLGTIGGGRFPELPRDALQWDFAVRELDGDLVLVPTGFFGIESRAALTPPIEGETFESLREVPGQRALSDTARVVMRPGNVYAARSRTFINEFGQQCFQFAKLEPLETNISAGILRLQIVTNGRCSDPRLVTPE